MAAQKAPSQTLPSTSLKLSIAPVPSAAQTSLRRLEKERQACAELVRFLEDVVDGQDSATLSALAGERGEAIKLRYLWRGHQQGRPIDIYAVTAYRVAALLSVNGHLVTIEAFCLLEDLKQVRNTLIERYSFKR